MVEKTRIDLTALVEEFADFAPDETFTALETEPFVQAMAQPDPEFVIPFLKARKERGSDKKTAVRDLYAFLLSKRYFDKLNLLYFAFDVFCSRIALPDAILNMTPLPHEEGAPLFKYKLTPGYKVE